MARPKVDLDALIVPKATEEDRPTPAPAAPGQGSKSYAHTLSLRLTAEQYRRLRRFVADEEEKTGRRATHQSIIETALEDYLNKRR